MGFFRDGNLEVNTRELRGKLSYWRGEIAIEVEKVVICRGAIQRLNSLYVIVYMDV